MSPTGSSDYVLRRATDQDFDPLEAMVSAQFGWDPDAESHEREQLRFEADRDYLILDRENTIVGNAGAYSAALTVPGAVLPAALVTGVAVEPAHRRQGLLRRLMAHQLTEIATAGQEPIAVLWASEGRIYQRFGYGLATRRAAMAIESREVVLQSPAVDEGRVRTCSPETVRAELEGLYARVLPDRPGWFTRSERWWTGRLMDPKSVREGASARRVIVYERAGDTGGTVVDGYAMWRMKPGHSQGGPNGEVRVIELVAATTQAYVALWRHLLTMDLTRKVFADFLAVDEPLVHLVDEPRRLRMTVADGLWLRVVDLPAALAGRWYAAPVDVVIEVSDAMLPQNAGRWRLRSDVDGVGTCEPAAGADPDLVCDIADLGAVYLGGTPLGRLADAGRVRELKPYAIRRIGAAFGWHRDPAGFEMF
ncbi:MAG: GNAT family N-acetyltransferase [Micromonosporaceae bacterium]|nr:GNAT family N-acetyltransferase [Micromonosporaceae bacterium]